MNIKHQKLINIQKFTSLVAKSLDKILDSKYSINSSQGMILLYVYHHPEVTQKDVSCERGVTPAAISRSINFLVKKKYLIRTENKGNKRENALSITPQGFVILKKIVTDMNKKIEDFFSKISKEELEFLEKIFMKLLKENAKI